MVMLMASSMPFTVQVLGFSRHCGWIPDVSIHKQSRTLSVRKKESTYLLYGSQNEEEPSLSASPADALLNMVEEIASGQFSPEIVAKMQELEQSLTAYLNTQGKEKYQQKWSPRPPGTPPPLRILQNLPVDRQQDSLAKAEIALDKLRDRLRREEEGLRRAEEALQQSLQEEEILRRAEEALQRSREAAEKRKLEAIRQTEAAVASAEQARKDSEEAARVWDQEQFIISSDSRNDGTIADDNYDYDDDDVEGYAYYRKMDTPRSTIPLGFLTKPKTSIDTVDSVLENGSLAPLGIPILYNWVQYIDGSIQGQVRNSEKFEDGAVIATSPVTNGANAGTIIETSSGSKYYLGMPTEITGEAAATEGTTFDNWNGAPTNSPTLVSSTSTFPNMVKAPDGVPTIVGWKTLENGGVAGLIYGSRNAENGDYIETSPIANGAVESGQVVTTISGSRYFLSPDEEDRAANAIAAFQDLVQARQGSTITITKNLAARPGSDTNESTDVDMPTRTTRESKPRPTFSLFDLFGKGDQTRIRQTGGKTGPGGVPMLSKWNANPDGTITGIVSGSPHLNDGDMVTTSPIVSGTVQQYEKVITETGSTYYLS